jgi:alkanesulfonate monooxygenase SsuD/methylene tetrahydromethanopterin reductase-like flavin-dependent oxidoreductase (luciferase family)
MGVGAGASGAANLREEVLLAEAAGFDAVFFSEHHGAPGFPANPLTLSGFVLGVTSLLRAGPYPLLLPLHHPVRVAEDSALLDFASDGRLILGLGSGYLPQDFAQIGIPPAERQSRFVEGIDVIRKVWEAQPRRHAGRHYVVNDIEPLAYRSPSPSGPPLWIAGSSGTNMRLAARAGDALALDSIRPTAEVRTLAARFRTICDAEGGGRKEVVVGRRMWFGAKDDTNKFRSLLRTQLQGYLELAGAAPSPWLDALRQTGVTDAALDERVFTGDPVAVAEAAYNWAITVDVDYLVVRFQLSQFGNRDFRSIREQLKRARLFLERFRLCGSPSS